MHFSNIVKFTKNLGDYIAQDSGAEEIRNVVKF
jgi:hypothetical protein